MIAIAGILLLCVLNGESFQVTRMAWISRIVPRKAMACAQVSTTSITRPWIRLRASFTPDEAADASKLPIPPNEFNITDPDSNYVEWSSQIPDKKLFRLFFKTITGDEVKPISLNQLCTHPEIQSALSDGLLDGDDIDYIWDSDISHGDEMLDMDGAYELFCAIMDVPDPEEIDYLNKSYDSMSGAGNELDEASCGVSLQTFLGWEPIIEVVDEKFYSVEDISQLWIDLMGSSEVLADRKNFGKMYLTLGRIIDSRDDDENGFIESDGDDDYGDDESR